MGPMNRRTFGVTLLAGVTAAGVLGACSSSTSASAKQTPGQAVASATSNLGAQSGVTAKFSIPLTASQLEQIKDASGTTPPPQVAKALTSGQVIFTEVTGHGEAIDSLKAATDSADQIEMGLQLGSDTPVDVRYTGQNAYLKVDANQLLKDVGEDPSQAAKLQADLSQLDQYVPGLSALGQGKWVEVTHASISSLSALLKQYASSQGVDIPNFMSAEAKLRGALSNDLYSNSTFAKIPNSGSRNGYSMTLAVRPFVSAYLQQLTATLGSAMPSKATNPLSSAASGIPASQKATIDLYVAGGRLSEADLDLAQFGKLSSALPVRLAFSSASSVSAPSGATALDLSKLPTLIQGMLSQKTSS